MKDGTLIAHIDSSSFSILYGQEVLPEEVEGGETEFLNMLLAYKFLSDEKESTEPLHQVHSYNDIRRLEPSMPALTIQEKWHHLYLIPWLEYI